VLGIPTRLRGRHSTQHALATDALPPGVGHSRLTTKSATKQCACCGPGRTPPGWRRSRRRQLSCRLSTRLHRRLQTGEETRACMDSTHPWRVSLLTSRTLMWCSDTTPRDVFSAVQKQKITVAAGAWQVAVDRKTGPRGNEDSDEEAADGKGVFRDDLLRTRHGGSSQGGRNGGPPVRTGPLPPPPPAAQRVPQQPMGGPAKCFTLSLCPTLGRVLARLGAPLLLLLSNQSLRQARLSDVIVTLAAGWVHQTVGKAASVRRILALAWCGVRAMGALDSLPHSMWTPRIQHRLAAPRSVHPRSSSRRAWRHNRRSRRCHSRHPLTRRRLRC
jgi:hypothetical protein